MLVIGDYEISEVQEDNESPEGQLLSLNQKMK